MITNRHERLPEHDPLLSDQVVAIRALYRAAPPDHLRGRIAATVRQAPTAAPRERTIDVGYRRPFDRAGVGTPRGRSVLAAAFLAATACFLAVSALSPAPINAPGTTVAATPWEQAWPMAGHDPRGTRRSLGNGPTAPTLLWTRRDVFGPVLIEPDGSIAGWAAGGLSLFTAAGRTRWTVPMQEGMGGPPALGSDGLVRVSAEIGGRHGAGMADPHTAFVAISPAGKRLWTVASLPWASAPHSVPFSKGTAPIVTTANVLYMPMVGPAYANHENNGVEIVSARGKPTRRLLPGFGGPIAVAPGGTVYALGYDYASAMFLLAARTDGTMLWQRELPFIQSGSVLIARNGRIYASDGSGWGGGDNGDVAAYSPAGALLWHRPTSGVATLAERADGAVAIADRSGLTTVTSSGATLWHVSLGKPPRGGLAFLSLAVDARGVVFAGCADGRVRAFMPDGALLWSLAAGKPLDYRTIYLALGPHGVLSVVGADNVLRVYR